MAMSSTFFKPKIANSLELKAKVNQLLVADKDNCNIIVPYGLQKKFSLAVSKPISVCLHSIVSGVDYFVLHYGAGVCSKIAAWMHDGTNPRPRKIFADTAIEHRFTHLLYIPSSFIYIAACADMTIRTYSNKFDPLASLELLYTVLDMTYCEYLDVIIVSGVGFIQILKLGQCLHEPPRVCTEISLPSINRSKQWAFQIIVNAKSKEILALSHDAVFFVTGTTVGELACNKELKNRHKQSLSSVAAYPQQHYIITGSKDGTIKAWNTAMQRFPLFGNFQGHTKAVLQLCTHCNEPLLFSSSADDTIRIWSIETFCETYRFHVHEPILNFKLIGTDSILYTTNRSTVVCELSLFFSLFSSIGTQALHLSRATSKDQPSRIIYVGKDGGVRLVSPVHGSIICMTFPIIGHGLVDVVHDPRGNASYACLDNGNVMVFSTETNPCSTVQLWVAKTLDDKVCSVAAIETDYLCNDALSACSTMLLFAGHMGGYITLIKGKNFQLSPVKVHQGSVTMLKARTGTSNNNDKDQKTAQLVSYATDNMIVIWNVSIREATADDSTNKLVFTALQQICMIDSPLEILLVGETLVITTLKNITFHRLLERQRVDKNYNQSELFSNSKVQDHSGNIKQVCCCESLQIIATSSKDRYVRIWDTDNNLIKELGFDDEIEALCFANDRGDLLVALQGNLYHVPAWNCLNKKYLRLLLKLELKDDICEKCIAFDPLLKFWYDAFWVQEIPIGCTKAALLNRSDKQSVCPNHAQYIRLRSILLSDTTLKEPGEDEIAFTYMMRYAKRRSTVFKASNSKTHIRSAANNRPHSVLPPLKESTIACSGNGAELQQAQKGEMEDLKDLENRTVKNECMIDEDPYHEDPYDEDLYGYYGNNQSDEDDGTKEHDAGNSEPIETGMKYWPCAPDGFLPNSIIRSIVQPKAPPDYTNLIKEIDEKETVQRLQKVLLDLSKLPRLISSEQFQSKPETPDKHSEESISEIERQVLSSDDDLTDDTESEQDSDIGEESLVNSFMSMEVIDDPAPVEDSSINVYKEITESKEESPTENIESIYTPKLSSPIKEKSIQKEPKPTSSKANEMQKSVPIKANLHSEPNGLNKSLISDDLLRGKMTSQRKESNGVSSKKDDIPLIFKSRMDKNWFPKDVDLDVKCIVHESLKGLDETDLQSTKEIFALLVDIKKHLELTTPLMDEALRTMKNFFKSKKPAIKLAAVKTAVELASEQQEAVIPDLIKLLNDPVKVVREEAKRALELLAGIKDFETLQAVAKKMSILEEKNDTENYLAPLNRLTARRVKLAKVTKKAQLVNDLVHSWLLAAKPKAALTEEDFDDEEEEDVREIDEISKKSSSSQENELYGKMEQSVNQMEIIAPRLAKKFEKIAGFHESPPLAVEEHTLTDNPCDENEAAQELTDLLRRIDSVGCNVLDSLPEKISDETADSKITKKDRKREKKKRLSESILIDEPQKSQAKSKDNSLSMKSAKTKERLFSLLLEVSAYVLLIKRNALEKRELETLDSSPHQNETMTFDDATLANLSSFLTLLSQGDSKILRVASHLERFLKNLRHQIQQQTEQCLPGEISMRKISDDFERIERRKVDHLNIESTIEPTCHQSLIRSPIRRTMVPGIRGERVAQEVQFIRNIKRAHDTRGQHKLCGLPERLGSVTVANSGVCNFGKMRMMWTSKAPFYDMDFAALNEQRIRGLQLPPRSLTDINEVYSKDPTRPSTLPLLVKQRLNITTRQMSRGNNTQNICRHNCKENVIRLPQLTTESEDRSRPVSTGSSYSQTTDTGKSKIASHPPPPPNTAEIRS